MFNLSGSEMVFLLLIALIVLGPEKLPEAVRKFGKAYSEFKKMSSGFQSELKSALDEPMREMRETAEAFKQAVNFDFDEAPHETAPEKPAAGAGLNNGEPAVEKPAGTGGFNQVEPAIEEPAVEEPAVEEPAVEEPAVDVPEVADNEPPLVRPPGPNFTSAAPQKPTVVETVDAVEAVEETATE
jgi:sec-independent protein translocase protein TatB